MATRPENGSSGLVKFLIGLGVSTELISASLIVISDAHAQTAKLAGDLLTSEIWKSNINTLIPIAVGGIGMIGLGLGINALTHPWPHRKNH